MALRQVIAAIFKQLQILYVVVDSVAVDVMHHLRREKVPPDMLLHDESVFGNVSVRPGTRMIGKIHVPIATYSDNASFVAWAIATQSWITRLATVFSFLRRRGHECNSARQACVLFGAVGLRLVGFAMAVLSGAVFALGFQATSQSAIFPECGFGQELLASGALLCYDGLSHNVSYQDVLVRAGTGRDQRPVRPALHLNLPLCGGIVNFFYPKNNIFSRKIQAWQVVE